MSGTPGRLLIVDDEPGFTRFVEYVAEGIGLEVRSLHDGSEVEAVLATWAPGIILLDINMPGRDALGLLGLLAARNYAGQVVVISGAAPEYLQMTGASARMRGLNLAAVRTKPIRKQELEELLLQLR